MIGSFTMSNTPGDSEFVDTAFNPDEVGEGEHLPGVDTLACAFLDWARSVVEHPVAPGQEQRKNHENGD